MKILIDIQEETYNKMRRGEALYPADANVAIFAIETGTPLEECDDCISRQAAIDELYKMLHDCFWADDEELDAVITTLNDLPPVKPQYTDTEIQKMQDLEFAEIQKAYEIGKEEGSIGADVLDKIRAEIEAKCCITVGRENDGAITLHDVFEIIDKYKASPTGAESEVQDADSD